MLCSLSVFLPNIWTEYAIYYQSCSIGYRPLYYSRRHLKMVSLFQLVTKDNLWGGSPPYASFLPLIKCTSMHIKKKNYMYGQNVYLVKLQSLAIPREVTEGSIFSQATIWPNPLTGVLNQWSATAVDTTGKRKAEKPNWNCFRCTQWEAKTQQCHSVQRRSTLALIWTFLVHLQDIFSPQTP